MAIVESLVTNDRAAIMRARLFNSMADPENQFPITKQIAAEVATAPKRLPLRLRAEEFLDTLQSKNFPSKRTALIAASIVATGAAATIYASSRSRRMTTAA